MKKDDSDHLSVSLTLNGKSLTNIGKYIILQDQDLLILILIMLGFRKENHEKPLSKEQYRRSSINSQKTILDLNFTSDRIVSTKPAYAYDNPVFTNATELNDSSSKFNQQGVGFQSNLMIFKSNLGFRLLKEWYFFNN